VPAYDKYPEKAPGSRFDGETGESVPLDQPESHQEVVAQYYLHPEAKVYNGDHLNNGVTRRRHIVATAVEHFGKDANKWDEQHYLASVLDDRTEYGTSPEGCEQVIDAVLQAAAPVRLRRRRA